MGQSTHSRASSSRNSVGGPIDLGPFDRRILNSLLRLDPSRVRLFQEVLAEASVRLGLDYVRDSGERILIPVNPAPALPTRRQITYMAGVLRTLSSCVARLVGRRLRDSKLAKVLPLEESEVAWLQLSVGAPGSPPHRVFHRWDCTMDLSNDATAKRVRFFEVNSVDVGGIHYAAVTREIMLGSLRSVGIKGLSLDPTRAGSDSRLVLLEAIRAHAKAIGRKLRFLAIAENQDFTTGITEAASIAQFFCDLGVPTECVDVRKFQNHRRKGVCVEGRAVDVIYRNIELRDLCELEAAGADLSGMRAAASAGQLLSSPFGELDHKSLWEVLGSEEFNGSLTQGERKLIARHIPWTRLLSDRKSTGPDGKWIDLPSYARRHRTRLVMKPNRSCGGQGVTIGSCSSRSQWEATLDAALATPSTWVVQELIQIPRRRTATIGPGGHLRSKIVYAVYGIFGSPSGLAFVGRASANPVVNVMQGGGMLGILARGAGGSFPIGERRA